MTTNNKKHQNGSSMIEVLVSLVVLATGILGMAGLQSESLKNSKSAYYKTQATILISDLVSRLRVNGQGSADKSYVYSGAAHEHISSGSDCKTSCTASQLAKADLDEWIAQVDKTLPRSEITISKSATDPVYTITLFWDDARGSGENLCEVDAATNLLCLSVNVKVCANDSEGGFDPCEL